MRDLSLFEPASPRLPWAETRLSTGVDCSVSSGSASPLSLLEKPCRSITINAAPVAPIPPATIVRKMLAPQYPANNPEGHPRTGRADQHGPKTVSNHWRSQSPLRSTGPDKPTKANSPGTDKPMPRILRNSHPDSRLFPERTSETINVPRPDFPATNATVPSCTAPSTVTPYP